MGHEAGLVALEAVQDGITRNPVTQPEMATNQALMAQRFDVNLNRATEASTIEFQTGEAAHRKSIETSSDSFKTAAIPEVEARSAAGSPTVASGVVTYLNGFSQKTNSLVSDLHQAAGKPEEIAFEPGTPGQAASPENGQAFDMTASVRFLVRTFEVSVETHFVANAARESTGTFNQLMKGQ
jgi:hypothetical protein